MALLFIDSFDHYSTSELANKWTTTGSSTINAVNMRTGIGCLGATSGNTGPSKTLPGNYKTLFVGAAFKISGASSGIGIIALSDSGTVQTDLRLNLSGNLYVTRNGTTLATSVDAISYGVWYYIELGVTIDNSGSYTVKVNGDVWLSGSADTQATGNAYANTVIVRLVNNTSYIDDLYICDNSGSINNTFLGDVKVECIMPESNGYINQWAVYPSGSNYTAVDEIPPNSDTDYVTTSGVGYIDSYAFGNLTTLSGSIFGVQVCPFARKDDAGSRTIAPTFRIGVTTYSGAGSSIGNTYTYWPYIQETNPATAGYWNISDVNDAEFGIKLVS